MDVYYRDIENRRHTAQVLRGDSITDKVLDLMIGAVSIRADAGSGSSQWEPIVPPMPTVSYYDAEGTMLTAAVYKGNPAVDATLGVLVVGIHLTASRGSAPGQWEPIAQGPA